MPSSPKCPHLLMIPFADKGHVAPMMYLAEKLACEGLYITVIFTERSSMKDWSSENIHTVLLEKEPHGTKAAALESLIDALKRSSSPPTAVIVDIIVRWSKRPIENSKLPRYVVYTAGCAYLYDMLGLPPRESETAPVNGGMQTHIDDPEMPPFDSYDWKSDFLDSQGILVNSSYELEKNTTDRIQAALVDKGISVFPVGPLVPLDPDKSKSNVKEWLDEQQPWSVLYISFGSRTYLHKEQIVEVANGLERSGQPFLWVLPVAPEYSGNAEEYLKNVLPDEFRSKPHKGLVMCSLAPQKMILQHRSVFGFVTHCGWNSILESVYLAGKPMLCWPFGTDQPANARFVVHELRVGLEIKTDQNGIVSSEEIERKVKALVKDEEMRKRMSEVRSRLLTDESSRNTLSRFAKMFYN